MDTRQRALPPSAVTFNDITRHFDRSERLIGFSFRLSFSDFEWFCCIEKLKKPPTKQPLGIMAFETKYLLKGFRYMYIHIEPIAKLKAFLFP